MTVDNAGGLLYLTPGYCCRVLLQRYYTFYVDGTDNIRGWLFSNIGNRMGSGLISW